VTAAIFWLKTRARWKETTVNEHAGVPGQPIEQITRIERVIIAPPHREADAATPTLLIEHSAGEQE
jgi:hypothetical protein